MKFVTINSATEKELVIAPETISHALVEAETVTLFTKTGESYMFYRTTIEIGDCEWNDIVDSWHKNEDD